MAALKTEFTKVTSRSVIYFGSLIVGFYGSSVDVRHEVAHLIVNRRVDLL